MKTNQVRFVVGERTGVVHVADKYGRTLCRPNRATRYANPASIGMEDCRVIPIDAKVCAKCSEILGFMDIKINSFRQKAVSK